MNLDDLIFPTSIATPSEASPSPAPVPFFTPGHPAVPTSIPIKARKSQEPQHPFLASAPGINLERSRQREFGYVQRHIRKTSVDEGRVRLPDAASPRAWLISIRLESVLQNPRLKFLPSVVFRYPMSQMQRQVSTIIVLITPGRRSATAFPTIALRTQLCHTILALTINKTIPSYTLRDLSNRISASPQQARHWSITAHSLSTIIRPLARQ